MSTRQSFERDEVQKALDRAAAKAIEGGKELNEYDMLKIIRREKAKIRMQKAPHYIEMAKQEGLQLKAFSEGHHYLVNERFDWWPSSGAWRDRKLKHARTNYGFWKMVNKAKQAKQQEQKQAQENQP